YELPQYGSRRRLLSPSGMYDEYGEVMVENDGGYYYSPHGSTAEEVSNSGTLVLSLQQAEATGMSQSRGPSSRGISQIAGAQIEGRPLDGGMDLRHGSGRAYRTSQGRRKLKAVMHLSRIAVSAHKPVGRSESARSPWKKTKIFPMILQKVKSSRKDSSYAKLMSARQVDGDKSMIIRGSYFQKSIDDRPSMRKLNHVLKRVSVSRKFQETASKDAVHAEAKEKEDRDEAKSGVSISVTAESEHEDSDYEKKKKKRRKYSSDESSAKSSSSGSESEDKDYLTVTLDQDEATESTVDSDEESGDSDDSSESSSSSESEEDSSEEDSDEEESDSDEDDSLSQSSSTQSSFSKSGTSDSSSRSSTVSSSLKSRVGSSRGRARRSSQKSVSSNTSGASYRKTSGSSYKSKTSSASLEIKDTIQEVSEEDEQSDMEQVSASPDKTKNKTVSKTSANTKGAKNAANEEGKRRKSGVNSGDNEDESTEEVDTDASDKEEAISKNKSSCLESEISVTSKVQLLAYSPKLCQEVSDAEDREEYLNFNDTLWARKKRIKLVVDPEYETSSTGEDSAPDSSQRNRLNNPNIQNNVNGNIYIAQNGSVVRTRRVCLANNLKVTSPVRLGKQFKKLDKLAVTHEENVPLSTLSKGPSSSDKMNTRPCSVSFASSIGAENIITKSGGSKMKSTEEQESVVDNEDVKEPLESHSEHTQSDEEELWMGPWNNLHIPMTKL
ncbi:UNVERIFIED_CONTAM: hypothetical protein H355_008645, partial [Colinus virginianus]